eukprot:TRINITY_DN24268_c1_g3_i1.p1 TRINITY_DN24268_c1_g3~~TRINITY_DN24268_c1_g3_i1.p1  ORF type:complete len:145 (+),score=30.49 TRINITY_DN24268_c1_g3_i1:57-491(+)
MAIEGKLQTSGGDSVVSRRRYHVVDRAEWLEVVAGVKVGRKRTRVGGVEERMTALLQYVEEKDTELFSGVKEMLGESVEQPKQTNGTPVKRARISLRRVESVTAPSRAAALQTFIGLSTPPEHHPKTTPHVTQRFTSLKQFVYN